MRLQKILLPVLSVALLLGVDLLTKEYALEKLADGQRVDLLPFLSLALTLNKGISFGLLKPFGSIALMFLALCVMLLVASFYRHALRVGRVGVVLILGGALGNLCDRVRWGAVVDFVDLFLGRWHFFVFNFADVFISLGFVLLVFEALWKRKEAL